MVYPSRNVKGFLYLKSRGNEIGSRRRLLEMRLAPDQRLTAEENGIEIRTFRANRLTAPPSEERTREDSNLKPSDP